jgi:hypothetical protein
MVAASGVGNRPGDSERGVMAMRPVRTVAMLITAGVLAAGAAACGDDGDASPAPQSQGSGGSVEAPTEIVGGDTFLRLDPALERVLDVAGVAVEPAGAAEATARGIRFPIRSGSVDIDTLSGKLEHEGGLRFSALGRSLQATDLVIRPGDDVLSADIEGRRVPLLSLDFSRPRVVETSDTVVLPATAGTLADDAVQALNSRLGIDAFEGGLRLGRVTSSAQRP